MAYHHLSFKMKRKILALRLRKAITNMKSFRRVFSKIHRILTNLHTHQVSQLNSDTSHSTFSLQFWIEALWWVTNQIKMSREWINFTKWQHQRSTILILSLREVKLETSLITLPILLFKDSLRFLKCNLCNLIMSRFKESIHSPLWAT